MHSKPPDTGKSDDPLSYQALICFCYPPQACPKIRGALARSVRPRPPAMLVASPLHDPWLPQAKKVFSRHNAWLWYAL